MRDPNIKWSYKIFNEERKKIKIEIPKDHVIPREQVIINLKKKFKRLYCMDWTRNIYCIKLGNTTNN